MGLTYPDSLADWQSWQDGRRRLRAVKRRLLDRGPTRGVLSTTDPAPEILVAVEAGTPSQVAALLAPLAHLTNRGVAVLAPHDVTHLLPGRSWTSAPWSTDRLDRRLDGIRAVLASGHFLALGAFGHSLTRSRDLPFLTVQHGLLTPHSPPLAPGTTLLAWSEADAEFWRSGRDDVSTRVVGSQLLWEAATDPGVGALPEPTASPTYLGQLHGAELPRTALAAAAEAFCRAHHATYRPHPAERDRASRRQHAQWEAAGMVVDHTGGPLAGLGTPVVSVFSTGVLEAAARGVPAWVDLPDPPPWLEEFWSRNAMHRWGDEPTPSPDLPATEPARLVADVVGEVL